MRSVRKYLGLFLVVVYAFYFASTNFFYHSHQLANYKLVHSHPFSGSNHSHTASQILLIDIIDSTSYQESSAIIAPDFVPALSCVEICQRCICPVLSPAILSFSLRAPPTAC